ncbi:hypothetical protein CISIN_1g0362361mg, partial [Citrus sinensis]
LEAIQRAPRPDRT